ncbi:sel1 repeat family protein [Empedobacter brevis]|uniref:Sel1 repeat family protein n=1 Tax=Empedobacter brevis TaxID=247 RepID=A0AAJ1V8R1_9FLAO|nr:tetratricopeptide repeat protein [Empedobacter brevis]MDM1073806.1 sel1 repeat family protein [Empedobacter brevis]
MNNEQMTETFEITNIDDWNSLLKNAESGNSNAMNEVAFWYENGLTINDIEIIKIHPQLAFEWTKKSYDKGNLDGIVKYADYLSDGEYLYCEKNIEFAMHLYEKAMNEGSITATHSLGIEYRNKQNFEKAFELYQKANASSNFFPELSIGLSYYYGIGTPKNKIKALEIFKKIEIGNNSEYEVDEANYLIGKIYLEGEIVEQSIDKARQYLELADKDGDHRSAQELLIIIGRKQMINQNTSR